MPYLFPTGASARDALDVPYMSARDATIGRTVIEAQEMGDTGWRVLTSWDSAGTVTGTALGSGWGPRIGSAGGVYIRRVGSLVSIRFAQMVTTAADPTAAILTVPANFRATDVTHYQALPYGTAGLSWNVQVTSTVIRHVTTMASGAVIYGALINYHTPDAWPTSLPGTAL